MASKQKPPWFLEGVKEVATLSLTYDAGNALEPFYYFILDYLKKEGFGDKVLKIVDYYNYSQRSPEWSGSQTQFRQDIQSASSLLGTIGSVLTSVLPIMKDKARVEQLLKTYEDEKKEPEKKVLKGIWADFIDPQTGMASFAQASKSLQFYSARDLFFTFDTLEDLKKAITSGKIKLTTRLLNYLERKYSEYEHWRPEWRKYLLDLKNILDERVTASKNVVMMYKKWVEPLIRNVEGMTLKSQPVNPELLKIGGNVYSQVVLVAYLYDLKKSKGNYGDFVPLIEFNFTLRGSSPAGRMKTVLEIKPKVYTLTRFKKDKEKWEKEIDPAGEWVKKLMLEYEFKSQEEILKEKEEAEKKEAKEKKKKETVIYQFGERIKNVANYYKNMRKKTGEFLGPVTKPRKVKEDYERAEEDIKKKAQDAYLTIKIEFGMLR